MKKAVSLLLVLVMMLSASFALAATVKTINKDTLDDPSVFESCYKVVKVVGSKEIPVRSGPKSSYPVVGKIQPDSLVGYINWWSDNLWIRVLYNDGNSAGWVSVKDLR